LRQSPARALRALLLLLLPAPVRPVLRVPLPVADHERPRREDVVLSPAPRRGPPVFAPAC
ncbi:hypothetical protein, partial [Streptomyces sp. CBMA123]|uniref:hypothetical protein n=1 Tax=Streptomyces sp. CBMA123 TaxID=1896313 RepID=UPI0016621B7E